MIIVTTETVPGATVSQTMGIVRASCVRARHVGSDIGAGLKTLVGGRIGGYEKLLEQAREEALARLASEAKRMGADAVVCMRMATSAVMQGASEVLVYGTAVRLQAGAARPAQVASRASPPAARPGRPVPAR